jgi:RNA polymerase sigma-70 factor (ECF subfamily)
MFRRDPLANPERLIRRVYSYVAYRLGDGPEAEDVTSEVFERALRYRDRYDPSKGEPLAWLLGIARRSVDGAFSARPPVAGDIPDRPGHDDLEEDAVQKLTVAAAVSRLEERDRELIALRYGADLSAAQIGELLGLRPNTVEVALHRALERLKCFVEPPSKAGARRPPVTSRHMPAVSGDEGS